MQVFRAKFFRSSFFNTYLAGNKLDSYFCKNNK